MFMLFMPWWAEPQRHALVVMCVCLYVRVYVFHMYFFATAKN